MRLPRLAYKVPIMQATGLTFNLSLGLPYTIEIPNFRLINYLISYVLKSPA